MEEGNKYSYYLHDLGAELRLLADDARREARSASHGERKWFEGQLFTYASVLSLMQQQADGFDIPYSELSLEGLDPERDLILTREGATPKEMRPRGYHSWNLRLGRLRLLFTLFAHREPRELDSPEE